MWLPSLLGASLQTGTYQFVSNKMLGIKTFKNKVIRDFYINSLITLAFVNKRFLLNK